MPLEVARPVPACDSFVVVLVPRCPKARRIAYTAACMERFHGLRGTSVGAYQLWDCLGHGSCTAVYRASTEDAQCAIKLVDVRLNEGGELAERLVREQAILNAIGHRGILPIQEAIRARDMTAGA